jgi:hypothetical protein
VVAASPVLMPSLLALLAEAGVLMSADDDTRLGG